MFPRWSPSLLQINPARADQASDNIELNESADNRRPSTLSFPFSNTFHSPISLIPDQGREDSKSEKENAAVFFTWEDLWVFTSSQKGEGVPILSGLTGLAQPGQILAIMGPSGCGKSTLLDALAGRLASNLNQTGKILVNARKQALAYGTSAYVTQEDVLMTTLTVREAILYSAELQLPSAMSRAAKRECVEKTMQDMGLAVVADVQIGGRWSKGISGGQRRRVSISMEIIRRPKVLFLDEPTSGLDSAAAFHVINHIAKMAKREKMTVAAVVHQPGYEVFELFQSICILACGQTIFFGSPDEAPEFFTLNGFSIPSHKNPSDHYLKTINKDFDMDIEEGPEVKTTTAAEAIEILAKTYLSSMAFQRIKMQIDMISEMEQGALKKKSQASFLMQCLILTKRSFVNMYRDLGYYWLRFIINLALCLCVGTIFYKIGNSFSSIQARGSMMMFIATFLTFMAIGGFPSFVEDMKIFNRERLNGHYGLTSFTIATTLSATPYLAMISVIPGSITYNLVGLQRSIDHFIYFVLVLFSCMMLVEGLMMIVASVIPDFLMGIIIGAGIQGVMMLNGGFFQLPNDLPKPLWRYPMYYVGFHKYATQGLYKNEFMGLIFPNDQVGRPPTIAGEEILKDMWQLEMGYSKWVDLTILLGMVVLYRILFLLIIKMREKLGPLFREFKNTKFSRKS